MDDLNLLTLPLSENKDCGRGNRDPDGDESTHRWILFMVIIPYYKPMYNRGGF